MRFFRYNLTRLLPSGVYLVGMLVLWALDAASLAAFVWASWLGTALTALLRLYQNREALCGRPALSEARRLLAFRRPSPRRRAARGPARGGRPLRRHHLLGRHEPRPLCRGADACDRRTEPDHQRLQHPAPAAPRPDQGRRGATADPGETLRYVSLLLSVGTAVLLVVCPLAPAVPVRRRLRRCDRPVPRAPAGVSADGAAPGHHPRALRHWRLASAHPGGRPGARDFAALVWPLAHLLGLLGIPTALLVADVIALAYLLASCAAACSCPRPSAGA